MGRPSKKDVQFSDPLLKDMVLKFTANVKVARLKQELTQQDLASKCGLALNTISEIEQQRVEDIKLGTIVAVCKGLGEKDIFQFLKKRP